MSDEVLVHEFAHAWQAALSRRPASEVLQPFVGESALAANVFPRGAIDDARVAALLRAAGATRVLHACVEGGGQPRVVATMVPGGARSEIAVETSTLPSNHAVGLVRAIATRFFEGVGE